MWFCMCLCVLCVFFLCDCDMCVVVFERFSCDWLSDVCDVGCVVCMSLCFYSMPYCVCCVYSVNCHLCSVL